MPELWDAVYDNEQVEGLTRRVEWLTHRGQSRRFLELLERFRPDAIACTQSYPFGLVSALQERGVFPAGVPLFGIMTDYRPHRFWVRPGQGRYVVPSAWAADRLVQLGVDAGRILVGGIPIRPGFAAGTGRADRADGARRVLVMGGTLGLGVRYGTIRKLDRGSMNFTMDIVTGKNDRLRRRLLSHQARMQHSLRVRGYARNVPELMRRASLLVSKPGGMTCAEAMACGLPMLVVRPLPGQESGNLEVLLRQGAAVHLEEDASLSAAADAAERFVAGSADRGR